MSTNQRPARVRGMYEDQFWEFVSDADLRLQRSSSTGSVRYPPSPVCPDTLDPGYRWEPLCGTATLLAWTVFRREYFAEFPLPYTVVAVRSAEGPIFVGHLPGDASASLSHGMAMNLVYEEVSLAGEETRIFNWIPANWVPDTHSPSTRSTSEEDET